jgi:hypothetical protein
MGYDLFTPAIKALCSLLLVPPKGAGVLKNTVDVWHGTSSR